MPKLFSRLPVTWHRPAAAALGVLSVLCAIAALGCFLVFSQTTETTGHLWWKETREIPFAERRPYMLAGIGLLAATAACIFGSVELVAVQAQKTEAAMAHGSQSRTALPFLLARAIGRGWERRRRRNAEILSAMEARRAAAQAAAERWRYERSTAGQAESAFERGDEFFSIELEVDGTLAQHLNDIYAAGWRQKSVSQRHRKTTHAEPRYDGTHEVTRETIEYRTYLFRRDV